MFVKLGNAIFKLFSIFFCDLKKLIYEKKVQTLPIKAKGLSILIININIFAKNFLRLIDPSKAHKGTLFKFKKSFSKLQSSFIPSEIKKSDLCRSLEEIK